MMQPVSPPFFMNLIKRYNRTRHKSRNDLYQPFLKIWTQQRVINLAHRTEQRIRTI